MIPGAVLLFAIGLLVVAYIIFTGKDDGDDDYTPSGAI